MRVDNFAPKALSTQWESYLKTLKTGSWLEYRQKVLFMSEKYCWVKLGKPDKIFVTDSKKTLWEYNIGKYNLYSITYTV